MFGIGAGDTTGRVLGVYLLVSYILVYTVGVSFLWSIGAKNGRYFKRYSLSAQNKRTSGRLLKGILSTLIGGALFLYSLAVVFTNLYDLLSDLSYDAIKYILLGTITAFLWACTFSYMGYRVFLAIEAAVRSPDLAITRALADAMSIAATTNPSYA